MSFGIMNPETGVEFMHRVAQEVSTVPSGKTPLACHRQRLGFATCRRLTRDERSGPSAHQCP
jgi:hypothetical protein